MRRLILLRHGKAERGSATGQDVDRVLTEQGRRDAAAMGESLAALGFVPTLVLVSAASRALQTWRAASPAFPQAAAEVSPRLYLASAEQVWAEVQAAGAGAVAVMVVGHNPGLHELALRLAHTSVGPERQALENGFPTAAAAIFSFEPEVAALAAFMTPKGQAGR